MNKQFNTFNTLESHRFVHLEKELSKVIKMKLGKSVKARVRSGMQFVSDRLASVQSTIATNSQHGSKENKSDEEDSDNEPPIKKLKFLIPTSQIPTLTPLNSVTTEFFLQPEVEKMIVDQFTDHLLKTTLSNSS
ncbi:hypothetical protein Tco_0611121 [Tanacetum coccineum]